jgi:hypothetical protein
MFGFIKKLITGILGFLAGLLPGSKKNGGYYLQLDESAAEPTPAPAPKPAPEPVATSNGTQATAVASQPEKKPAPAPKAAKVEASKNGKAAPTEPVQAPAAVATKQEPAETAFASKYLIPTASNGRRRPGANMSSFLEMASQIKTPAPKA